MPASKCPPCSAAGLPTAGEAGPLPGEAAPFAVAALAAEPVAAAAAASLASCDAAPLLLRETDAEDSCMDM